MSEFLHMGGYAVFVWSAYGVVALVLIGLTAWTLAALGRATKDLADMEQLAPRRRRAVAGTEPQAQETPHAQP